MVKYRLAGIGGRSELARLGSGMVRGFDHGLQFLACMKCHDSARGDWNFFAGFWIAAGALRLLAQLEVAEARKLDRLAGFEGDAHFLEKPLDHVLGFAFVEAELLEEQVGKFGFGQCHVSSDEPPRGIDCARSAAASGGSVGVVSCIYWRNVAPNSSRATASNLASVASMSASVKVREVSCISTRIARLFRPSVRPRPR